MANRLALALVLCVVLHAGSFAIARDITNSLERLKNCQSEGKLAGQLASLGACSGLILECPIPTEKSPPQPKTLSPDSVSFRFEAVVEWTCATVFVNHCKRAGTTKVFAPNFLTPECGKILEYGPGPGAEDCATREDAINIFSDLLTDLCESNKLP